MADSGNIKVVVRCRPMNSREKARGASYLIEVNGDHQLVLSPPPADTKDTQHQSSKATVKKAMPFSFDRSYDENTEQRTLFEYVGLDLLSHAFNGFNTCVFAYGQTGSGKSHSMVGYAEAKGLIPLTCSQLFDDITSKVTADPNLRISVEVSYIEIYNEKVRDLLNPKNKGNLKVREHPSLGPYVEDLSKLVVPNFSELMDLMDEGNKARTVASTNMNETSSRSHAVFTLILTQKRLDVETKLETEKVSRISLVDLAGSERANSTGATGARLKEGANINRSLTTLGKVIAALAQASMQPAKSKKKEALENFVPYRDSVLTWLLKDSLGGNSKTAMIAAISPADYEETLSTLRYADQAKKIKNKAVVNEDPNAKLIRELKEELDLLRNRVQIGSGNEGEGTWDPSVPPEKQVVRYQTKSGEIKTVTKAELQDQLEQSEKIMSSLNESWETKLIKTQEIQKEREKALEELGISVDKGNVGVHTPKKLPHLVNLNEDPLMSECLIYQLKDGKTIVGNLESDKDADVQIRLSGENILSEHCFFENLDGTVTINASQDSMTMVNGKRVKPEEPRRLRSGYRVILGDFHVFRFNNPEEVRKARDKVKSTLAMSTGEGENGTIGRETDSPGTRPDSPASEDGADMDWTYARREAALARLSGKDVDFDKLNENDLDKLFEDISRARSKKSGGRPESRMSFFDDGASESASSNINRPYSLSTYTDDTSVDPWQGSEPGSIRTNGLTSTPPIGSQSVEAAKETADLKLKVKEYEEKIHQINLAKQEEVVNYTEEQKRLIRWTLKQWRSETTVSMAEDVLSHAVLLKEANVLSKQLGKKAVYQFTIIEDGALSNPTSGIDTQTIAGLGAGELDDVQDYDLTNSPKPCVAVRVLDHSRSSIHIWSLSKLEQRLQKMRNLYAFIDRPEYSRHFDWADPFYESSSNNSEDPSSSSSSPFAFVGSALIPLKPLARKISAKYESVPIRSKDMNSVLGNCNVELKFISISFPPSKQVNGKSKSNGANSRNGALSPNGSDSKASSIQGSQSLDEDFLPSGHKLGLQLTVDAVKGLNGNQFSSVHLQIRLSSLTGSTISSDDVYTSTPVDLEETTTNSSESGPSSLKFRKTISFLLTPEISNYIKDGYAPIEMYARVRSPYLQELERFDSEREEGVANDLSNPITNGNGEEEAESSSLSPSRPKLAHKRTGSSSGISLAPSTSRISETEMVSEEKHDILTSIQICELNSNGEYEPVQVKSISSLDPGSFFLRQGLQRKIIIKLSHDSGKQFLWKSISKIELGEVRLLDSKGKIHISTTTDPIVLKCPTKQQSVEFFNNGISELESWCWWDSSIHDSIFLNRFTTNGQRVLLKLNIFLDFEKSSEPAKFELDIAVSINPRESKPSGKFFSMIESVSNGNQIKVSDRTNCLFNLILLPPLTKKSKDLWRLDTGKKYVRGQEIIKDWKPRGVSLIHDHRSLFDQERKRAQVEAVRVLLKSKPPLSLSENHHSNGNGNGNGNGFMNHERSESSDWENEGERTIRDEVFLQRKVLDLWMKAVRDSRVSILAEKADEKRALELAASQSDSIPSSPKLIQAPLSEPETLKLKAKVKMIQRTDVAARRGWLMMPVEAFTDNWIKRWFVLKRPYLHVFNDREEVDEVMVMNLSSVRLEHDENVEMMLDRKNVFCLYTASNSYFLQSRNPQEMQGWMNSLDAFHTSGR